MSQVNEVVEGRHLARNETALSILPHDELVRMANMTLSAMKSLYGVVSMAKAVEERMRGEASTYWTQGVGGAALEKGDQVFALLNQGIDPEQHLPWHDNHYFSLADDLMFDISKQAMLGTGWRVCEPCEMMMGSKSTMAKPCARCGQPTRPITWKDLEPWPEPEEARTEEAKA